jgi:hypothetical protein
MWGFRQLVLPHAWAPELFAPGIPCKALLAWFAPFYWPLATGTYWQAVAAILFLAIFAVAGYRSVHYAVPSIIAVISLPMVAQFVGPEPNFAKIIIPQEMSIFTSMLAYLCAVCLFVRYVRSQPGLVAATAFALVNLPILQYFGGKHYHYWPNAFLAVADAAFAGCLFEFGKEIWRRRKYARVGVCTDLCVETARGLQVLQARTLSVHD